MGIKAGVVPPWPGGTWASCPDTALGKSLPGPGGWPWAARGVTLVLLQRLRELERGSRALLEQRLRVLHRLHGLLQRDKVETLRQLQEALEQVREGRREQGGCEAAARTQPSTEPGVWVRGEGAQPGGHGSPDVLLL